jgi:hypothetical protein
MGFKASVLLMQVEYNIRRTGGNMVTESAGNVTSITDDSHQDVYAGQINSSIGAIMRNT